MLKINSITKESAELNLIRDLFEEYAAELDENLCFQNFGEELKDPLKKYGSPHGSLLLAYWNNEPAGCIALQPLQQGSCEMKRLFIREPYRKQGIADALVNAILIEAKEKGFTKMVLDTLQRLQPAIRLYKRYGFENISAYYKNPIPDTVYMQKMIH